ncbi:hypothetical protein A2971_02810 [Candidatus Gottesmanbacteria bacterium RIFCSPLOWO2_01_FULL_46_21]|uniref:Glycosyltransferase RgtA/B/C/D-like domain-containing protein n=1 Tax=Candidatus Gottesmanbacteria bacterium RIFCSPLOWO2_01_FULL_46_21 TaxID=1798393 RepID=A0A1F6AVC2_9BACT|nr:MAG: hypothetical protein A2971_02810 [Candidatus Gottesmanbacteria bacterium RIFCSPLOWO2_01_FULL_46_21]
MAIPILVLSIIGFIYLPWLTLRPLSAGDWPYLFTENIRAFSWFPEARFLWLAPYYQIITKFVVTVVGIRWEVAEKLLWFLPFIILSAFSSYRAFRSWISVLIYTTNTYILMIVGGGQMGVAMAYAIAPLVFSRLSFFLIVIQAMFDPRIALLTIVAALFVTRPKVKKLLFVLFGVFVIHLYWIIPMIFSPSVLGERLSDASAGMLKFLSFASFSQTISLLHPNWPENIFGKVYFMQPEFLVIPTIAFSAFLFGSEKGKAIPYGLLALVGAFLAKGTQEPFGGIYTWLFTYVPGFWLFRDSTKFYLLVALAYAYIIPKSKVPSILIVLLWAILIRQALTHELTGTFQPKPIDPEYIKLKELILSSEKSSSFWVPSVSRYAFFSTEHPAIAGQIGPEGYIIVPWDSRGEIFLTERQYDDTLRQEYIASVSALPNLQRDPAFTKLAVWKIR